MCWKNECIVLTQPHAPFSIITCRCSSPRRSSSGPAVPAAVVDLCVMLLLAAGYLGDGRKSQLLLFGVGQGLVMFLQNSCAPSSFAARCVLSVVCVCIADQARRKYVRVSLGKAKPLDTAASCVHMCCVGLLVFIV